MLIGMHSIPHCLQRYETVGDWILEEPDAIIVKVSDLGNEDFNFLVALHELIEAKLCQKRGISEAAITAFDMAFEAKRLVGNTDEPGDDPQAPYRREHFFATNIERLMAEQLGVDWREYEEAVNSL